MTTTQQTQNVQGPPPVPSNPPMDPEFFIDNLLHIAGYTVCGMWRAATAFLKNYNTVQDNSMTLMQVSEAIENRQLADGQVLIAQIGDQQTAINTLITEYSNGKIDQQALQNGLTAAQGQAAIENTEYNSVNQFWSGLNNGVNQTSADESQTESLDMQMFQQGPLTLVQQLANAM